MSFVSPRPARGSRGGGGELIVSHFAIPPNPKMDQTAKKIIA